MLFYLEDSFSSILILPPTFSLLTENLIEFLEVSILTVSLSEYNSLQILVNSLEDKVTIDEYCVSGIPKCSLSIVIKLNLNSLSFFNSKI